jgi:hypothetical protein
MNLRPQNGGFHRHFGPGQFIVDFLKGNGAEESKEINPNIGAPMTDIHFEHKSSPHRAHARDAVEWEEERRIRRGKTAYSEEEYQQQLQYFLDHIRYKLRKMRYASFTRYFGHLKRFFK